MKILWNFIAFLAQLLYQMHSKKGKRTQSNLKYFNYYENIVIFYYILSWLNYGDANTKFFHLKTLQNRSQSHITTLKDSTRLWVSKDMLTTHVIVVFTKLFMSTSPHIVSHFPLVRYYHQNCRVTILGPKPKLCGLLVQWAQYNEFVESESKNWAQVNLTTADTNLKDDYIGISIM